MSPARPDVPAGISDRLRPARPASVCC